MLHQNKQAQRRIILTACFSIIIAIIISGISMIFIIKGKKDSVEYHAIRQGNILKYSVDTMLLNLDTLSAMVVNGNGEIENFDTICKDLIEKSASENAIGSLQLAPNGVVTQIYPEAGNAAGKIDLFADPDRKTEAEWARDTGNTTLAGPYELLQGGFSAVARKPIYLENAQGKQEFWGFVVEVLNMDETLQPAHLDDFSKDGYDYCFWRKDAKTGKKAIISKSTDKKFRHPISVDVKMPNVIWHFDVQPKGGWVSFKNILCIFLFLLFAAYIGVAIAYHGITQEEKQETVKRNSVLKKSLNNIANNVAVFRIQNEHFIPIIANRQFLNLTNMTEKEFDNMNVAAFLEQIGFNEYIEGLSKDERSYPSFDYEKAIINPETQKKIWYLINGRTAIDKNDSALLYITMTNIMKEKHREKQLRFAQKELAAQIESGKEWEYYAEHDPLTGLLNRKAFERITSELTKSKTALGFVLIDIDYFKEINDDYGHDVGDKLLQKAAKILSQHVSAGNYAFRFGGDEFAILLCNSDINGAEFTANRIHEMSEQLAFADDSIPTANFSAGIYYSTDGFHESVYQHADEALYHTKKNGRAGCTVYDENNHVFYEHHENLQVQMKMPRNNLLAKVNIGTWRIEISKDAPARLYCDESMLNLLGVEKYTSPEECYNYWFERIDPDYVSTVFSAIDEILANGQAELCYPWHHPKLGIVNVRCGGTCDDEFQNGTCIYGIHQNITNTTIVSKGEEKQNIIGFAAQAEEILKDVPGEYAMLHWDIKGFKAINDQIGYERGNKLLRSVSLALKNSSLKPLVLTRDMADHFYCLVKKENVNYKEIRNLCNQHIMIENSSILVDMHCGIYFINDKTIPVRYMCDKSRIAENALNGGEHGCSYFIFTDVMEKEYFRKREILSALDETIEQEKFYTYFQPIYDAKTRRIISAEALVRWVKPDGQLIPPNVFIPTLEENGQISRIDLLISDFVKKCIEERSASKKRIVPISVNLSRMDFYNEEAMTHLLNSVSTAKIPHEYLRYEITESAYSEIPDQGLETIKALRENGAEILVDDFGKGYSSLGSLTQQNFDIVKLDMSFIRQIGLNERAEAVITASIEMIHMMGASVVAEGVETKEQYEFLLDKNCDYIQGYYFSKPLPREDFEALLDLGKI